MISFQFTILLCIKIAIYYRYLTKALLFLCSFDKFCNFVSNSNSANPADRGGLFGWLSHIGFRNGAVRSLLFFMRRVYHEGRAFRSLIEEKEISLPLVLLLPDEAEALFFLYHL